MSESALYRQLNREAEESRAAEAAKLEATVREHPVYKAAQAEAERLRGALDQITARVDASPSQWIKREFLACVKEAREITLTATLTGVQIAGRDFTEGATVEVPVADADRLIQAALAKEATHGA